MEPSFSCSYYTENEKQWYELIDLLRKLGYTLSLKVYVAYHSPYNHYNKRTIVVSYRTLYLSGDKSGMINCYDDIVMFLSLITINADRTKYHLFIDDKRWYISANKKKRDEFIGKGYRDIPLEKIVECRRGSKARGICE